MKRFVIALLWLSGSIAAAGYLGGPYLDFLPPICPFRMLTGRPCLFCGISHAVAFAVRGDFINAAAANPAWFIVLPLFNVIVSMMLTRQARLWWGVVGMTAIGTLWAAIF